VAEDGRDLIATGAFHVHEIRVGRLDESLQLAFSLFLFDGGVEEIFRERHGSLLLSRDKILSFYTNKSRKDEMEPIMNRGRITNHVGRGRVHTE